MTELGAVLGQLRQERIQALNKLRQLDQAISALARIGIKSGRAGNARRPRHISAAARKRISAAQKARWAKFRKAGKSAA